MFLGTAREGAAPKRLSESPRPLGEGQGDENTCYDFSGFKGFETLSIGPRLQFPGVREMTAMEPEYETVFAESSTQYATTDVGSKRTRWPS